MKTYAIVFHLLEDDEIAELGNYDATINMWSAIIKQTINIYLYQMWSYVGHTYKISDWNMVFSHAVSHEMIHKSVHELIGVKATKQFDNIAGKINKDIRQIGIGMNRYKEKCL